MSSSSSVEPLATVQETKEDDASVLREMLKIVKEIQDKQKQLEAAIADINYQVRLLYMR
jgi:hypothetical protein